jgi:hypothetical protein
MQAYLAGQNRDACLITCIYINAINAVARSAAWRICLCTTRGRILAMGVENLAAQQTERALGLTRQVIEAKPQASLCAA